MKTSRLTRWGVGLALLLAGPQATFRAAEAPFEMPLDEAGWWDLTRLLAPSDGTRSTGDNRAPFNDSRDKGSKIVYFDPERGDNATADVYWWDGQRLIDSAGRAANPDNGRAYGADPRHPDEAAIRPFKETLGTARNAPGDPRLRSHERHVDAVAGGYPDWFLYRRGRTHTVFDNGLVGGRSEREPMVIAAYGPEADGRAVIAPAEGRQATFQGRDRNLTNPLSQNTRDQPQVWLHLVLSGLDCRCVWSLLGAQRSESYSGGPVTAYAEDCRWIEGRGMRLVYLPQKTVVRRCQIAWSWNPAAHNQGYYNADFKGGTTFEEVIFYKNGYKTDPKTEADPRRDIFSRNIYQGGGGQMGHHYRGIISADGGSGGPQMRLGGSCENSLIIEGYWYSATNSNQVVNPWLTAGPQTGQSALVRRNVQLIFAYPTPHDPDTAEPKSDNRAQPAWGYTLQGQSFGALIEDNIISGAMLFDELGAPNLSRGVGLKLSTRPEEYQDGRTYTQQRNTIRNNIVWRTGEGLSLEGDWTGVKGNRFEGNVLVANRIYGATATNLEPGDGLTLTDNEFYGQGALPDWAQGNRIAPVTAAVMFPDPNRTLKRYVTEVLGLTLLDWSDDPFLDPAQRDARARSSEAYDPTGLKTFMAVALNMRRGAPHGAPPEGKPSWTGDYAWDARYTGPAVVNWIRAGFGRPPVDK